MQIPTLRTVLAAAASLAVVGALGACSPADNAESSGTVTDVTIQIDGAAVPYYAPLYAAVEEGYFKEHGLNVKFAYAEGSSILQNVAAGNVDFGFPNGDSVITAKAKGVDVDVVHTTYQQGIGAVLFNKKTAGITGPADLAGKTVAVTDLGSPNYVQLQAMLEAEGLSIDDVKVKTIGSGAIVSALQNGEVDAIAFSRLRYFALQSAGFPVGQILSDKYLPSFGNVLVTSPQFREGNSKAVRGFVAALDQGIEYTIDNPTDAVSMSIEKYADSFAGQEDEITKVVKDVYIAELWQSDATRENGLGYGDLKRWQAAIDAQAKYDLIDETIDAKSLVVQPSAL